MSSSTTMTPWLAIGAVVVVAAFLAWYLWATSQRRRARRSAGKPTGDPRDTWDALSHGEDPTDDEPPLDSGS